jgi:glycosyltransferase involved in cell wall biosynthesis
MKPVRHQPQLYICSDSFGVSGVTTQAYYLARGMAALGWDVHVICYSTHGNYYPAFSSLPITIHQINTFTCEDFDKLYSYNRQDKIDIAAKVREYLHHNAIFDPVKPGVLVINYMLSMLYILDSIPHNIARTFILHSDEKYYYHLLQHFYHHFDGIVAVSEHIYTHAQKFVPLNQLSQPTAVIPYGIETPITQDNHKLKIIYTGRFVEYQKRIFDTLEIAYLLKLWQIPFHLTLAGDQSNRITLDKRIQHLGLEDCISIIGPLSREEVSQQLKLHHVFLLVSEFEGLSLSLLEAMAHGTIPVVSKISSGVEEVIQEGVNGFLVETGDIHGFASVLRDLAAGFSKFKSLSNAAVTSIRNKGCTAETMAYRYAKFFDRVLSWNDLNCDRVRQQTVDQNFALEEISPQSAVKITPPHYCLPEISTTPVAKTQQITYIQEHPSVTFFLDGMHVGGVQTFVKHMLVALHQHQWNARLALYVNNLDDLEVRKLQQQGIPIIGYSFSEHLEELPQEIASALLPDTKGIIVPNFITQVYERLNQIPSRFAISHIFHADEPFYYDIFQNNLSRIQSAIAVSQVCYQKANQILKNNSTTLPLTRIPYGVKMNSQWLERTNSQTLKIIYSGRIIEHQKCIFEIPELAALAKQKGLSCEWTLVGEGDDSELLMHRIRSLRVDDCINLVGRVTPELLSHLLNHHDVVILTSEYEGLPLALLEAMGHGCVPVVYDIPSGIHEIIKDQHNGFITPQNQRVEFVEALRQLCFDRGLLKEMSYHAWETVYPTYSVNEMVSKYINFFDEVLQNHDNQL